MDICAKFHDNASISIVVEIYVWILTFWKPFNLLMPQQSGLQSHLLFPVVLCFCVKVFIGSAPCLGQGPKHVPIGCWTEMK